MDLMTVVFPGEIMGTYTESRQSDPMWTRKRDDERISRQSVCSLNDPCELPLERRVFSMIF